MHDGDGVVNDNDLCANTDPNNPVGEVLSDGCDWQQEVLRLYDVQTNPAPPTQCGSHFSLVLDKSASFSSGDISSIESDASDFAGDILTIDPTAQFTVATFDTTAHAVVTASSNLTDIQNAIGDDPGGDTTNWGGGISAGNTTGIDWMIIFTDGKPNETGGPGSNNVDFASVSQAVAASQNVRTVTGAHVTVIGIDSSGNAPNGFDAESQLYAAGWPRAMSARVASATLAIFSPASARTARQPRTTSRSSRAMPTASRRPISTSLSRRKIVLQSLSPKATEPRPAKSPPGDTYHIFEDEVSGWQLASVACTDSQDNPVSTIPNSTAFGRALTIPQDVQGDVTCTFNNRPAPMITITAEKVICDAETYLPNWAGSGAVNHDRVQSFVDASNGACHFDPNWVFEVRDGDNVDDRPDDNIEDAPNFTNFVGSIQFGDDGGQHRVREQHPSGYVNFTGVDGGDVSAEFYCDDDVENYDNLEWVSGSTNYCVGFNALNTATLRIGKDDGTNRIAGSSFLIQHKNATGAVIDEWCVSDNNAIDPTDGSIAACDSATLLQDTNSADGMIVVTGIPQGSTMVTEVQGPANHEPDICQGVRNFTLNGTDWSLDADPAQGCQHNTRFRNTPSTGTIWNVKVVTNDPSDDTTFMADVVNLGDASENYTASFTQNSPHSVEKPIGFYTSTEQGVAPEYAFVLTQEFDGSQLSWDDAGPICPAIEDLVGVGDSVQVNNLLPGGDLVFCHYNYRMAHVVLTKYENIGGADTWDFTSDSGVIGNPSFSMPNNTVGITISESDDWWVAPADGPFTISESNAGTTCEDIVGALPGDYETLVKVSTRPHWSQRADRPRQQHRRVQCDSG